MKLFAAELDFRAIAREFVLPETFPEQLHSEAILATDRYPEGRRDLREVEFVTIDPPSSMDLDQAVHVESWQADGVVDSGAADSGAGAAGNAGSVAPGWRVRYAIADVGAFVEPDSALEQESIRRGQTMYLPDDPVRLHPAELSEGSASLLPDQDRPAVVWDINVDGDGEIHDFTVYRATVRSRAKLNYEGVEADRLAGTLHPSIALLPELGEARQRSDLRRDAVNLRLPSISVEKSDDEQAEYQLVIEPRQLMNDYNAELSLLAGMCAGQIMVKSGKGILRTLPPASPKDIAKFDSAAKALGFERGNKSVGQLLASIDASTPQGMALMRDAQRLLRGASYVAFGIAGVENENETSIHAGIGGHYAHVTAPLRRLSDRFATEICLAIAEEREVPAWVAERADEVIEAMKRSTQLANQVDRACMGLTEAVVLQPWVGQNFSAAVMHSSDKGADIFVSEPPVIADCQGNPEEASQTAVTLITADPETRTVEFAWPAD